MRPIRARPNELARHSRCCDVIERRLARRQFPGARLTAQWWRRPLTVLSGRNRALNEEESRLSSGSKTKATEQQLAEVKAARLRVYAMALKVERYRHFDDYALTQEPVDIGVLVGLEEALMSAAWGAGEARERLNGPSPMSSVPNPSKLELQAKLIAAMETLPSARFPDVYAAVERAGYRKQSARKYMSNHRSQKASASGGRMRGNDLLFSRRDHWKAVLVDLLPEGLDLDTYFQAL